MERLITPSKSEVMTPGTPAMRTPEPTLPEPQMVFPRPSSDRAQDVSHILAAVFKDLYTRDAISKDIVQNLTSTSNGSSQFHKKCMEELKQTKEEHQRRLHECSELERHIIQARARAVSSDERALANAAAGVGKDQYQQLGLPNVKSNFKSCLNNDLMKQNNLIALSDIFPTKPGSVESPRRRKTPHYFLPTLSSSMHLEKGPVDDGYTSLEDIAVANAVSQHDDETNTTLSSDSFDLKSNRPSTKIKPPKKTDGKHHWQENMNQENRVEDRALLARLEDRHNFLKNPRFAGDLETINKSEHTFMARPSVVRFSEWSVGRIYEAVLELKNVSTIGAQLRVVPPSTSFFSVTLGKYPGEGSVVASGMSVKYNIRFMPDSLSDFDDEITIISPNGPPLVVPLLGSRNPPVLNLPHTINTGHCLVGGTKINELTIKNSGGNGRFCVLRRSAWPAVNFKTAVSSGILDIGQFQIRPAVFELLANQMAILEVLFTPLEPKKYSEDILVVCDNCQVQEFTLIGEGQLAAVEIVSVSDGGESEAVLGECTDMTADHLIRFPPLNPHSFYMKQVIVHNTCNVDMPYEWHCLKPNLSAPVTDFDKPIEGRFEFYPDESMTFFIEPRKGVLTANGIHEFALSFAPGKVGHFHNVMHMVLSNIPEIKSEDPHNDRDDKLKQSLARQESVPQNLKASDRSSPKASKTNMSSSSLKSTSGTQLREVIALEIEAKGVSVPYSVLFHPPAIIVPGEVLKGTTCKRQFKMANYSLAPAEFKWSNEMSPNIIEVEPSMGVIQPGDYLEMEVFVTGSNSGNIETQLECVIEHLDHPLSFAISAEIKGPDVVCDSFNLEFGLIKVGTSHKKSVAVRNTTQLHALWLLTERMNVDKSEPSISISPAAGELLPLEKQDVTITLNASKAQSLNRVLDLVVEDGKTSFLTITAEIQSPEVCFLNSAVVLKNAYLSVPQIHHCTMVNLTLFETKFKFIEPKGHQSSVCDVTVHPKSGKIGPQEKLEIQLTVACHVPGEIKEVFLCCIIDGMAHPIVLGLYANVQTLSVDCVTPGHPNDLKLDFGKDIPLGVTVIREVVITNNTSIRAPWSAFIKNFPVYTVTRPPFQTDFKTPRTRRMMLGRTPNLADPLSRTPAQAAEDHANLILKSDNGAAFSVSPAKGFLEPHQKQTIAVKVFSNMWGTYHDNLVCKIESLTDMTIPICAHITGCPLVFQVVAGSKNKNAVVRFGSHITNGPPIYRKMRVLNKSPCDVQVDWKCFETSDLKQSRKVVDMVTWYGKAFPKCDQYGNEIVKSPNLKSTSNLHFSKTSNSDLSNSATESTFQRAKQLKPKLVNVKIQSHVGVPTSDTFLISPSQTIIPAHGQATVQAIFQPGSFENGNWLVTGFAGGYMTLVKTHDKSKEDLMIRNDGYDITPLRLDMTACLKSASLDFLLDSDDESPEDCDVEFKSSLGYLLHGNEFVSEDIQYQNFTLKNISEMSLEFNAVVSTPFFMTKSPSRGHSALRLYKSARNKLVPQDNLRVKLGFSLSRETLHVLEDLQMNKVVPGAAILTCDGRERLVFNDVVTINYMNESKQEIKVCAVVLLPKLELSVRDLNFGVGFVGEEKCLEMKIRNVGEATSAWSCELHYSESSQGNGSFRIEPDNGVLEGLVSNVSSNETLLNVYYTPVLNKECNAIFLFKGILGETAQSLSVCGLGSHDGIYSSSKQ